MPRPAKKKGGRVTAPVVSCKRRANQPCKFTSRRRKKPKGADEFGPWEDFCSWCCRKKP